MSSDAGVMCDVSWFPAASIALLLFETPAQSNTVLPDGIKFAVLLVTLFLIILVKMIERNYKLFQQATSLRAIVLEHSLNLELTETIASKHQSHRMDWYSMAVYYLFELALVVLAFAVLPASQDLAMTLAVIALAEGVFHFVIERLYFWRKRVIDWTIDKTKVYPEEEFCVTVTNISLSEKTRKLFKAGAIAWRLEHASGTSTFAFKSPIELELGKMAKFSWSFAFPPGAPKGIYYLRVFKGDASNELFGAEGESKVLRRNVELVP